jgi:serine/threonine protein kinase
VRLDQRLILERGKKKERLTRNLLNNLFFLFSRRCKVCRDIVTGMDYLAKKGIIHRDLAARNVLIRKLGFGDVLCKLCDFGMGRALVEDAYVVSDPKATELPVRWTAPEALEKKRYSLKSDVFSFGVLVWEVESFGAEPYVGWPLGSILKRLKAGERLEQPTGCPDTLYSVMLQCWDLDPDKRPSWESLYKTFKDTWRKSNPFEKSGKFDEEEFEDEGVGYLNEEDDPKYNGLSASGKSSKGVYEQPHLSSQLYSSASNANLGYTQAASDAYGNYGTVSQPAAPVSSLSSSANLKPNRPPPPVPLRTSSVSSTTSPLAGTPPAANGPADWSALSRTSGSVVPPVPPRASDSGRASLSSTTSPRTSISSSAGKIQPPSGSGSLSESSSPRASFSNSGGRIVVPPASSAPFPIRASGGHSREPSPRSRTNSSAAEGIISPRQQNLAVPDSGRGSGASPTVSPAPRRDPPPSFAPQTPPPPQQPPHAAPAAASSSSSCDLLKREKREKRDQRERDPAKLREANEAFIVRVLNQNEPKMAWKSLAYFGGTLVEAKNLAKASLKPIYMSLFVNGPEPEVACLGARLFRCTVLSDPRLVERITSSFVPVCINLSEEKIPEELFKPALRDIVYWYNKMLPDSSKSWTSEVIIDVDANGVCTLLGGCSWIREDLEKFFSFEGYTKFLDKCMKKRSQILKIRQSFTEKNVVGGLKSVFVMAKGDLAKGANDIKHAWSFHKQMSTAPVTDETMHRLEYNGIISAKRNGSSPNSGKSSNNNNDNDNDNSNNE